MTALDSKKVAAWAEVVDDHNPLHLDASFAAKTRFGVPIVHGSLLFALVCDAVQEAGAGGAVTVRFRAPVPVGSVAEIEISGTGVRMRCGETEPVEVVTG